MRIALMTNNYKPFIGGVPISIERLAKGLRQLGHEVTVFAPTYAEQQAEEDVFRYSTCLNRFIGGIVLPNSFDTRIEKEFERQSYDIIHVHHPVLIGQTAVQLSRKYNIPLVFTYHTRYEQYITYYTRGLIKPDRLMALYLKSFLKHCGLVIAPTAGMQEYLINDCAVAPEKTGILPTGIENYNFEPRDSEAQALRKRYGCQDIPLFLTVSRMAVEKNVEFLLESLSEYKKACHKPFKMLLAGDGPDRSFLEQRSRELGLSGECIFTGKLPNEELAAYYQAADAFLFASKTETQGIVILEAFAGRTPVIAVRASGVEDLIADGENGFLTAEDTRAFAECLQKYMDCSFDREQMSQNALLTGLQYREEAVAKQAVRYYNNLIINSYGREGEKWNRSIAF